jgi:hypothetical protein
MNFAQAPKRFLERTNPPFGLSLSKNLFSAYASGINFNQKRDYKYE